MNRFLFYFVLAWGMLMPFAACSTDDEQDMDSSLVDGSTDNDSTDNDSTAVSDTTAVGDSTLVNDSTGGGGITAADSTDTVRVDSTEFCCKRDGKRIYGMMYSDRTSSRIHPTVILAHSSSLTHEAMSGYALRLAQKGMVAYCFDFCGGSKNSQSDGATDSMTVFTEVEDLRCVVKSVRELGFVDKNQVYLLGSSQGGLVSALLAEEMQEELAGMVLFYPAFNIPEMVKQFSGWGNMGNWGDFGDWGDMGGFSDMLSMSELYISSIKDYDVWSHIGQFPKPVCIIHGTSDFIVNISNSEKAVKLYPDATLHKVQGANHGFNAANYGSMGSTMGLKDYDDMVMPIVYEFLGCE